MLVLFTSHCFSGVSRRFTLYSNRDDVIGTRLDMWLRLSATLLINNSSVINKLNQPMLHILRSSYILCTSRSRWEIKQASQTRVYDEWNVMHLLVLTRCICLFCLGFGFCYVCTEYASAGVVKGCGYSCQAVHTPEYFIQSVYIFLFRCLGYVTNCSVHCQSTWFILANTTLTGVDWYVTWPG